MHFKIMFYLLKHRILSTLHHTRTYTSTIKHLSRHKSFQYNHLFLFIQVFSKWFDCEKLSKVFFEYDLTCFILKFVDSAYVFELCYDLIFFSQVPYLLNDLIQNYLPPHHAMVRLQYFHQT